MATVTVYFGTNRRPVTAADGQTITDFDSEPGPVDGLAVRFGSARVEVDGQGGARMDPVSLAVAPENLTGPAGFAPLLGSRTIFDALRGEMAAKDRPTLVTIHGFSASFQDAIERAATILDFYYGGTGANVFAFTWPSRGSVIGSLPLPYVDYVHDRGTAAASGGALARTIRMLQNYVDGLAPEERCNQRLHLLCHSTGSFVLRHGLQALLRAPDPALQTANAGESARPMTFVDRAEPDPVTLRRTFDQIVLAAADEDDDAFDDPHKLRHLPRLCRAVTVYHTERDWVLNTLSARTKFNGPRLGTDGPDNMAQISDKVSAVDVSDVIQLAQDIENHQYYRIFPAVRDDVLAALSGTRPNRIGNRETVGGGRWRLLPG